MNFVYFTQPQKIMNFGMRVGGVEVKELFKKMQKIIIIILLLFIFIFFRPPA